MDEYILSKLEVRLEVKLEVKLEVAIISLKRNVDETFFFEQMLIDFDSA